MFYLEENFGQDKDQSLSCPNISNILQLAMCNKYIITCFYCRKQKKEKK